VNDLLWTTQRYDELTLDRLYAILAARAAVFVVEQACAYQDLDGLDRDSLHVAAWAPARKIMAYARITPPGTRFGEPSIGRVLTTAAVRREGLGRVLMQRCLAEAACRYPGQSIRISAQQYLEHFYRQLGFRTVRGPYSEDGIPHLEMLCDRDSEQRQR